MAANWTRGLSRIYLLVVLIWLLYWFLWIPLQEAKQWKSLAQMADNPQQYREYMRQANAGEQIVLYFREYARRPVLTILFLGIPPLVGYGLLRLIILAIKWFAGGFRADRPNQPS
jgi:hypothetical protein